MNIERLVINHQFGGFGKVFANLPIYIFTTVRANGISQLALNNNNYGLTKCVFVFIHDICNNSVVSNASICVAVDVLHLKIYI